MINYEQRDFEFLLTLGNKIVCQRLFNVPMFNHKTLNSLDVYEEIKYICLDISNDLKKKNTEYLLENESLFFLPESTEIIDDNETYSLKLSHKNAQFNERIFPSNHYHPKVRYSVDIREKIKGYLMNLTEVLSTKKPETTYLGQKL